VLDIKTVVVLAPHADDGELGCGGTLARLVEQGADVHHVVFSICEASVPDGFPKDVLATEVKEANQVLSIGPDALTVHRYPVRHFPEHRQDILESLIRLRRRITPDLVFLPSSDDIHQDHQVVCQEGLRAFKYTRVLGYELPWNDLTFTASALAHLDRRHLQMKIDALRQYRSQWHRTYWNEDLITGLARVRGAQAGTEYAEAFQVFRWVIR
jgi:LmbE family N-acetylglucosaminyl deacetylase